MCMFSFFYNMKVFVFVISKGGVVNVIVIVLRVLVGDSSHSAKICVFIVQLGNQKINQFD